MGEQQLVWLVVDGGLGRDLPETRVQEDAPLGGLDMGGGGGVEGSDRSLGL